MISIRPYLSRRVEVRSFGSAQSEKADQGTLKHLDEHFVIIETAKEEALIFPTKNVRLLKVLRSDEGF